MIRGRKTVAVALRIATCVVLAGLLLRGADVCSSTRTEPEGRAVVINTELASGAKLPGLDDRRADTHSIARQYRTAGLLVAIDPTERCLAVTASAHISDDELVTGDVSNCVLAAGIMAGITSGQMAAREKGYLQAEVLTEVQLAAAQRIAQRHGMVS